MDCNKNKCLFEREKLSVPVYDQTLCAMQLKLWQNLVKRPPLQPLIFCHQCLWNFSPNTCKAASILDELQGFIKHASAKRRNLEFGLKHRKNCECCPCHSLFNGHKVIVYVVVLNCQQCNQCLKCQVSGHKIFKNLKFFSKNLSSKLS